MALRVQADTTLRAESRPAFERLADSKAAIRDRLRQLGAIHPIARLVWDDRAITVEVEFDIPHLEESQFEDSLDEVIERADEMIQQLAEWWADSRLSWESPGVTVGYS